jgi:hypothetical protein
MTSLITPDLWFVISHKSDLPTDPHLICKQLPCVSTTSPPNLICFPPKQYRWMSNLILYPTLWQFLKWWNNFSWVHIIRVGEHCWTTQYLYFPFPQLCPPTTGGVIVDDICQALGRMKEDIGVEHWWLASSRQGIHNVRKFHLLDYHRLLGI